MTFQNRSSFLGMPIGRDFIRPLQDNHNDTRFDRIFVGATPISQDTSSLMIPKSGLSKPPMTTTLLSISGVFGASISRDDMPDRPGETRVQITFQHLDRSAHVE
ncbi:hypothetical protein HBI56_207940 [Parastagonospora nodorum]|nr:hypothetical protein HBH56_217100 [Parastagonospora nodorum]KAH3922761.1 hypothetical protein HBH54_218960 [Parastagonospora nodorum]KAH3941199.1 hypothetical protein HBH53_206620 [Parastagonospora nodorum]KAH3956347.1 hypothetical protein HBH51_244260 [Parastagonospora nodorum]KAH3961450.1 hypothetical protein HBH52_229810 [Parastagonospora nodorum]